MSARHSPVYRKKAASTKSYRKVPLKQEIAAFGDGGDYTEAINSADSHEAARALLAKKQAALHAGRPPRRARSLEPVQEVDVDVNPDKIKDSGLRRIYERDKAREKQRGANAPPTQKKPNETKVPDPPRGANAPPPPTPVSGAVKPHPRTDPYAHGVAMRMTLNEVCARPDLSPKAKSVAMVLSSHWPCIKPTIERLKLYTGLKSANTVRLALRELEDRGLLRWKKGNSKRANLYGCLWLPRTV